MIHVVCFSGGKDSTALLLWAIENLGVGNFIVVFCDTKWEHPITMAYVDYIDETLLGGKLIRLTSKKYPDGFVQLVIDRKMIPGVHLRFCTQELKVFPLHEFFESLDDEITSYQGIRADESDARAKMSDTEWLNDAGGYWIKRPLLKWTAEDCFAIMERHGVKPNPLYMMGSARVGCWPCIMTGLGELKRCITFFPELKARLIEMERKANEAANDPENYRTWFRSDKIPARFCSKTVATKSCTCGHDLHEGSACQVVLERPESDNLSLFEVPENEVCGCQNSTVRYAPIPTCEDVFNYLESPEADQIPILPGRSCMSVYNLCE